MKPDLTIRSIELFKADLKLHEPFRISIMQWSSAPNVFVRINTEAGVSGFGEASPTWRLCGETQPIALAAARDLAALLKGKDALALEARLAEMEGFLVHNSTIRSAFDMALHDIAARAAGLPLWRLLGGRLRTLTTDLTISIGDPEYMAERARRIVAQGFGSVKAKLGSTAQEDLERVRVIRAAIGDGIPIRIDANQGWDVPTAVQALRALEPFGIEYCEQPVPHWDHSGMREVRSRTRIPIMADESVFTAQDAFKLAAGGCCDYFNIKLSKSGGLRNALAINSVAEACGKRCMVGCMLESRLGLTAAAHMAGARENIVFCDLDSGLLLADDPVIGGMELDADKVTLPDEPGLGAEVDPAFLAGLEVITV